MGSKMKFQVSVRMPEVQYNEVAELAEELGIPITSMIRVLMRIGYFHKNDLLDVVSRLKKPDTDSGLKFEGGEAEALCAILISAGDSGELRVEDKDGKMKKWTAGDEPFLEVVKDE